MQNEDAYELTMDINALVISASSGVRGNKRLLAFLNPGAPVVALAKSQRSSDWLERAAIAMHSSTPPEVVKRLSQDGNSVVRALARSRNIET